LKISSLYSRMRTYIMKYSYGIMHPNR
jgi:hypothetical protein